MTAPFVQSPTEIPEGSDGPAKDQHELHARSSEQHGSTAARSTETETGEDEEKYPSGIKLMMIGVGLMLAVVCSNLDRSILGVAIPQITSEFHSILDIGWYGSAYLLTSCCSQLMFGKLYAGLNIKWTFTASLAIFEIGSVLCAVAPSSSCLIVGRAVAGLGATGISTGSLLIISHSMPVSQRPKYTGMIGAGMGITLVFAPFLGGVFTSKLTWRWCFWINLPLGGLTLLTTFFLVQLPPRQAEQRTTTRSQFVEKFDIKGNLILLPAVICLLLALQWGGQKYAWSSWRMIVLLATFAICGTGWCIVQVHEGDHATIPMRLLKMRSILAAMFFAFCLFGMLFVQSFYVPIWFQVVGGDTAYNAGVKMLAYTVAMTIGFPIAGVLTSVIGYYVPFMIFGSIASAIASGLAVKFGVNTSTQYWMATLMLSGLGFGLGGQQCMMVPQTMLTGEDIALGTSVIMLAEAISGTVFLAVSENLLANGLMRELHDLVPSVDPRIVIAAGASQLEDKLGRIYDDQTVDLIRQAYSNALFPVWIIGVVLAALSLLGALGTEWVWVKTTAEKEEARPKKTQKATAKPGTKEIKKEINQNAKQKSKKQKAKKRPKLCRLVFPVPSNMGRIIEESQPKMANHAPHNSRADGSLSLPRSSQEIQKKEIYLSLSLSVYHYYSPPLSDHI